MTSHRAAGPFDVKVAPLSLEPGPADAGFGRMSIDKTFHGDLAAQSVGQMLSYGSPATGSAAYVALERVTGTLQGRQGAFVLQHEATMDQGRPSLRIAVVPGSGTDGLKGLAGMLAIEIAADGKHSYVLEYTMPDGR